MPGSDDPNIAYYVVTGDELYTGLYLYIYDSNNIYKHETKKFYIFQDLFGLILTDELPNKSFDNYNVIYEFDKESKVFNVNDHLKTDETLKSNLKFYNVICFGNINEMDYKNNINIYGFEQEDVDKSLVDYVSRNELVITYKGKCYNINEIINFYKENEISVNIDFNYKENDKLYENLEDFEKRIIQHPYITHNETKQDIIDFVTKFKMFKNPGKNLNDMISDNIDFVKNIGKLGIFAVSDNSTESSNSKNEFKLTREFIMSIFYDLSEEQKDLLYYPLFRFNNTKIQSLIDSGECVHGLGFSLCYIYVNILKWTKINNTKLHLKLKDESLFIEINEDLYMSFHVSGDIDKDLSLITSSKDLSINVVYYNLASNGIGGYSIAYGRGDINTTNQEYILSNKGFVKNYEKKYNIKSSDAKLRPVYFAIKSIGDIVVYELFKKGMINIIQTKNNLFEKFKEKELKLIEQTLPENIYVEFIKTMNKDINFLLSIDKKSLETYKLKIIELLKPEYKDLIGKSGPVSIELNKKLEELLCLKPDNEDELLKYLKNLIETTPVLDIEDMNDKKENFLKIFDEYLEQNKTESKKFDFRKLEFIVSLIRSLRIVNIAQNWLKVKYSSDSQYIIDYILQINEINRSSTEGSLLDFITYYIKEIENLSLKDGMIFVPNDCNCLFNCLAHVRNKEVYGYDVKLSDCKKQLNDMVRYLYNNFTDFKESIKSYVTKSIKISDEREIIDYFIRDNSYGNEYYIVAACQLYNVNIMINKYDEDGNSVIYKKIEPTFRDSLLDMESYEEKNRGTFELFILKRVHSWTLPRVYYTFSQLSYKPGDRNIRKQFINKILTFFINKHKEYKTNCVENPLVNCEDDQVCFLGDQKCTDKNDERLLDDYQIYDEVVYEFIDQNDKKFIGYQDDFEKLNLKIKSKKLYKDVIKEDKIKDFIDVSESTFDDKLDVFIQYVKDNDLEKVKIVLETFPDLRDKLLKEQNSRGNTSIMYAIGMQSDIELVKLLLEYGVDLNINGSKSGITPLIKAVGSGRKDIVKLLLDKGRDTNMINFITFDQQMTALMVAVKSQNADIVRLLLEYGARKDIKNKEGHTALDIAEKKSYNNMISILSEDPVQAQKNLEEAGWGRQ